MKVSAENCIACIEKCCRRCNYYNYNRGCLAPGKASKGLHGRYVNWIFFKSFGIDACTEFTPRDWEKFPFVASKAAS